MKCDVAQWATGRHRTVVIFDTQLLRQRSFRIESLIRYAKRELERYAIGAVTAAKERDLLSKKAVKCEFILSL
jgi:hypothetical protein